MTEPHSPRLKIALLASIAFNLFLGGLLIGSMLRPRDGTTAVVRVGGPPPGLDWVRRTLGEDAAPALDKVAARHGAELQRQSLALREARRDVDRTLEADSYDSAALGAALDQVRERSADMQRTVAAALIEIGGELTLEQRRRLVEARRAEASGQRSERR